MKVFVVNCGSSSIKYQLFDMTDESVVAKGLLERVGTEDAELSHSAGEKSVEKSVDAPDHGVGIQVVLEALADPEHGVLKSVDEIDAIGHRVVHGGEAISRSCRIDEHVIAVIRDHFQVSPLHNPPNLMGIDACRQAMPGVPDVAVFDTAFLSTLPPKAHRYAVPENWYTEYHVRKYGFHGTSHRYVTHRAAQLLGKPVEEVNLITAHLGNGCSMTAVSAGRAVDHSMGLTPLEGLMMGTRSGDLDPAVVGYMVSSGMGLDEVTRTLNKSSGLVAVSGISQDMRDLLSAEADGNRRAALAVEMFVYRIVKYASAYFTILPSLDAVVFTGGIGENAAPVRRRIGEGLSRLGATVDTAANERIVGGQAGAIHGADSSIPLWVVPTNEELMIARDTAELVAEKGGL